MTVHVAAQGWVIMGYGPGGLGLVPTLETIKETTTAEGRHRNLNIGIEPKTLLATLSDLSAFCSVPNRHLPLRKK
jgi:hypothetical protein